MEKIAIAQLNPRIGDFSYNYEKMVAARNTAKEIGATILVYTECVICGYPPQDLINKPTFLDALKLWNEKFIEHCFDVEGPAVIYGTPTFDRYEKIYNSAIFVDPIIKTYNVINKLELPNHDVFDERRNFAHGIETRIINYNGIRFGVMICEDVWHPNATSQLNEKNADLFIVINGSPYEEFKVGLRAEIIKKRIDELKLEWKDRRLFIYSNQVCGEDELVFDGFSFATDGENVTVMKGFAEDIQIVATFNNKKDFVIHNENSIIKSIKYSVGFGFMEPWIQYQACVLGLRDYYEKNGFKNGVILGMSGGIDSAVVAAMAADAIGPENVLGIMMPYTYTSEESVKDALNCINLIGMKGDIIPIIDDVTATINTLSKFKFNDVVFGETEPDITEENLQSRHRALILMALSNKFGMMVLSTGNKSEMSVGYATLYGDMCGGFNPIKDAFKLTVFEMAKVRNEYKLPDWFKGKEGKVIPDNILIKPPSAELRPDQKDSDSLPPYEILDSILIDYIERERSIDEIEQNFKYAKKDVSRETIEKVVKLVIKSEYKRRQAPPGVKLRPKSFGKGRRYPIANLFKE